MKYRIEWITWVAVGLFLIIIMIMAGWFALFGVNLYKRKQAERLLREIQQLHVGQTTLEDIGVLLQRYSYETGTNYSSHCPMAHASYSIQITSHHTSLSSHRLLEPIRPQQWGAGADLLFERGNLCYVSYRVEVEIAPREQELRWTAETTLVDERPLPSDSGSMSSWYRDHPYYWLRSGIIRNYAKFLQSTVTGQATELEKRRAFDFDLSCLTSRAGCHKLCEVMPSAWEDYTVFLAGEGMQMDETDRCSR
jgi:hypothetical protein